jgi:MFS family permease
VKHETAGGDGGESWADDRSVKAVLVYAGSLTIMAAAIISPALPRIREAFAGTPDLSLLTGLVLTLPALFIALGAPVAGALADRVGRLRVLTGAALLYALAGAAPLVLDSLATVLASRAVLGLAVAGLFVAGTTLVTDYYTGATRQRMLGLQGSLATASGVVFLPLAGLLAGVSWRGPFVLYLVSLGLLPAVALVLREPSGSAGGAGTPGGLDAGGAGTRALVGVVGLALVGMLAFYTLPVQIPFYVERVSGGGTALAGGVLAAAMLAGGVVAAGYRTVRAALGAEWTLVATFVTMAAGFVLLGSAGSLPALVAGVVVVGGAQGLLVPNLNAIAAATVSNERRGRALSLVVTGLFLGQFCSALASGGAVAAFDIRTMYLGAGLLLALVAAVCGWTAATASVTDDRPPAPVVDDD